MTSATKQSLRSFFILDSVGKQSEETRKAPSGTPLVAGIGRICPLLLALLTIDYAAECANDADEGATIRARVTFGGTLLFVAGATNHRVTFAENLPHRCDRDHQG